jgi:GntR family transcriptional regulator
MHRAFAHEGDLTDGRPARWSRETFLPGKLNHHVVRGLFEVRKLP